MNILELQDYFKKHPAALKMGAGKIGKRTNTNPEIVKEAKKVYRLDNNVNTIIEKTNKSFPKILIFDIETAPMKAYVWQMWKENISIDKTINDWFVICWSAKWLYSDEIMGDCLTTEEIVKEDDSRVVKSLWKLFNEATIVVAHNAQHFDVPRMNTRFILNNLVPPTPYHIVDTLQIAKKQFAFSSNKLDALAVYFGYPRKLETNFNLWKDCLEGNQKALDYMLEYNKRDVELLEEIYLKLRPYAKGHPNIGNILDTNKSVCSNCGSENLEKLEGQYYYTTVGKYQLYRCRDCGAITRGRVNVKNNKVVNTSILK